MLRLFIAGATGVLGRNLLPLLQERGHSVRALVRTSSQADALATQGVEPVLGDLLAPMSQAALNDVMRGCDAVLHLATAIPSNPAAPGAWDANTALRTVGTRALLDAALAAGATRYLQQSIVMAYIDGRDAWLDETAPFAATPTAAVVAEMEGMVRAVDADALAWCILRGGSFVGPDTAQQALLQRLREGRAVVPGDGAYYIAPVHVADMAAATALAIEQAAAGAVYNVCDEPVRYGDYVDALAGGIGVARPPRNSERPAPASCRADATAIRQQLGWTPAHPWLP